MIAGEDLPADAAHSDIVLEITLTHEEVTDLSDAAAKTADWTERTQS